MKQVGVVIAGLVMLTVMAACTAETSDPEEAGDVATNPPDYQWVQLGAD